MICSYVANSLMLTAYCLCLFLSLPLVFPMIYIVSVVMKLYEDMLQDEKKKRVTTIRYVLGSNIKSLRDFGTLLRRSISKEGKKV